MGRVKMPELQPVHCKKCNRFLAWVTSDSITMCPRCSVWNKVRGGGDGKQKAVRIEQMSSSKVSKKN
jgi:phage FluMu protein Com